MYVNFLKESVDSIFDHIKWRPVFDYVLKGIASIWPELLKGVSKRTAPLKHLATIP